MTECRRYYCMIRVDSTFNAGNLPLQNIEELNDAIEEVIQEWACKMQEKGLSADIGWNWSEHINMRG